VTISHRWYPTLPRKLNFPKDITLLLLHIKNPHKLQIFYIYFPKNRWGMKKGRGVQKKNPPVY